MGWVAIVCDGRARRDEPYRPNGARRDEPYRRTEKDFDGRVRRVARYQPVKMRKNVYFRKKTVRHNLICLVESNLSFTLIEMHERDWKER